MKFVRFDGGRTGLVVECDGRKLLDVPGSIARLRERDVAAAEAIASVLRPGDQDSWTAMIGHWDEVRGAFQTLNGLAESGVDTGFSLRLFDGASLEPPLASLATKIFAMGSNTAVHMIRAMKTMRDLDLTEEQARQSKIDGLPPFGFTVWPSTLVGPEAWVAPPRGTHRFDYEAECAVYVKTGGRYLETVDLWGYTAFNDFGVRDTHLGLAKEAAQGPFSLNTPKNFDSGKACGPWVVVDDVHDLAALRCVLKVNGEIRQDWQLVDMIYSFNDALTFLSQGLTLQPGDMLCSGTGAGVALEGGVDGPHWLKPGDVIEVTLDGAGTLRNTVGKW